MREGWLTNPDLSKLLWPPRQVKISLCLQSLGWRSSKAPPVSLIFCGDRVATRTGEWLPCVCRGSPQVSTIPSSNNLPRRPWPVRRVIPARCARLARAWTKSGDRSQSRLRDVWSGGRRRFNPCYRPTRRHAGLPLCVLPFSLRLPSPTVMRARARVSGQHFAGLRAKVFCFIRSTAPRISAAAG